MAEKKGQKKVVLLVDYIDEDGTVPAGTVVELDASTADVLVKQRKADDNAKAVKAYESQSDLSD